TAVSDLDAPFGSDTVAGPATVDPRQRPHPRRRPTHTAVLPGRQRQLERPASTIRRRATVEPAQAAAQSMAHHRRRRGVGDRRRYRGRRYLGGYGWRRGQPIGATQG